jgi:hypothetical protein
VDQNVSVGVALATNPQDNAACVIEWSAQGHGSISDLTLGVGDGVLLALAMKALPDGRVAVDAPFGWPEPFYDAIEAFRLSGEWPEHFTDDQQELRVRLTELMVSHAIGVTPSRASNDRPWAVRMRCARLLSDLWRAAGAVDRTGEGVAVEVHLEATLLLWGISDLGLAQNPGGYHGRSGTARRRRARVVSVVEEMTHGWLTLTAHEREAFEESDRLLDSLLFALVARAAETGRVRPVDDLDRARIEGWIALPTGELAAVGGALREFWGSPCDASETLMPEGGYLTVPMPPRFRLQVQERPGQAWFNWADGLRREWFVRSEDGAYCCTAHGGSPIWLRALSIDKSGVLEHLDGDGQGEVCRYRLVIDFDEDEELEVEFA